MPSVLSYSPRRGRTRYSRPPYATIDEARILAARRAARRRAHPPAAEVRPAQKARIERAVALYQGLAELLTGSEARALQLPMSLDMLQLIYELSDAARGAIEDLVASGRAVRASYMTVKQVAEAWSTSETTVRRCVRRGELRGMLVGRRLVFTPQELDRYLRARTYHGSERVYPDEPLVPEPLPTVALP